MNSVLERTSGGMPPRPLENQWRLSRATEGPMAAQRDA
jgi:hypothetical protein